MGRISRRYLLLLEVDSEGELIFIVTFLLNLVLFAASLAQIITFTLVDGFVKLLLDAHLPILSLLLLGFLACLILNLLFLFKRRLSFLFDLFKLHLTWQNGQLIVIVVIGDGVGDIFLRERQVHVFDYRLLDRLMLAGRIIITLRLDHYFLLCILRILD